jgi:hypothetical protein
MLAATSACDVAGNTAAAVSARAGISVIFFMARFLLAQSHCFDGTPLQHPCHIEEPC